MNSKIWAIGLLSVATISTFSLPVRSQPAPVAPQTNDSATIQDASQDSIVTGNGNYTDQNAIQTRVENDRRARGNSGNVQRSNQSSDVVGNRNDTYQNVEQTNVENGRRTSRPR